MSYLQIKLEIFSPFNRVCMYVCCDVTLPLTILRHESWAICWIRKVGLQFV